MSRRSGVESDTAACIVRTIWQNSRISRVGLAERLGLDKSTVVNQFQFANQFARIFDIGLMGDRRRLGA
jgi:hypothetical protein